MRPEMIVLSASAGTAVLAGGASFIRNQNLARTLAKSDPLIAGGSGKQAVDAYVKAAACDSFKTACKTAGIVFGLGVIAAAIVKFAGIINKNKARKIAR